MKRIISVVLAFVLILCSAASVFAMPSPEVDSVVTPIQGNDKDGNNIKIVIDELDEEDKAAVEEILKPDKLKELLGDDYSENLSVIEKKDVYIWDDEKGEIHYSEAPELFPVTISFGVPGVTPGKKVILLQYVDGKWSVVDGIVVGNGTIDATFSKLSPVVFLVENASGTSSTVSPLTGENNLVTLVSVLAAVSLLSSVVVYRRRRA